MKPVDENIRRLLQDLGRSLADAISSSSDVGQAVRRIRDEGYSLYLVLDCEQDDERPGAQLELATRKPGTKEPAFLLDGNDVSFLKSLGIDATRPGKRRRS